jgi:hypothetical protein
MSDTEDEKVATEEEKEEVTDLSDRYVQAWMRFPFAVRRSHLFITHHILPTQIHTHKHTHKQRCLHEIPRSGQDCESRSAGIGIAMRSRSQCLGFV